MSNRLQHGMIAGTMSLLASGALHGQSPRIARDLENQDPGSAVDVIVQYRSAVTREHDSRVLARGGRIKARLDGIRAAVYTVRADSLEKLADDPDVLYVSP